MDLRFRPRPIWVVRRISTTYRLSSNHSLPRTCAGFSLTRFTPHSGACISTAMSVARPQSHRFIQPSVVAISCLDSSGLVFQALDTSVNSSLKSLSSTPRSCSKSSCGEISAEQPRPGKAHTKTGGHTCTRSLQIPFSALLTASVVYQYHNQQR